MGGNPTVNLTFPDVHTAVLTLDAVGTSANILSQSVLEEISHYLDELEGRVDLQGLVIRSGKPGMFIAGADLREFMTALEGPPAKTVEMCHRGQQLFSRLSRGPYVSVACIDGICVGGGTELACWCDRRIASSHPKTEIGLPEVKLGIFPGWGGTVRLPRIIGLGNAVEMITSGESVTAEDALRMGLVSMVAEPDHMLSAAIRLVQLEFANGGFRRDRQRWQGPIQIGDTELAFLGATASAVIQQQTQGQYPAPSAALETMLESASLDADAACQLEAAGVGKLFGSEVNRSLLNVFFITDRNKKDQGVAVASSRPTNLQTVGVIGAGIMGAGIAAANLKREFSVVMTDASSDYLARGARNVLEEVSFDRRTKSANAGRMLEFAPRLRSASDLAELSSCDLVIEAVVENPQVKQQVFQKLESLVRQDAILASNTSTIPITVLSQTLQYPERFCGIHFFNPVRSMKLVEVIRGPRTSDATIATAVAHVKKLGKYPVVIQDGPGFLVNRLLFPYMNEALVLLAEGVPVESIEKAAKKFGMPMGPLELYDMVGMDTALFAGGIMRDAFPDRMIDSPILASLVAAGRLGRKSGRGFYSYQNKKQKREFDPELLTTIGPHVQPVTPSLPNDLLTNRLFMPMLLEATHVLSAGLVRDARDVDLSLIFGIGFPPFKGGLLFWADRLGITRILEMLKPLAAYGARFAPTEFLQDLVRRNASFYSHSTAGD